MTTPPWVAPQLASLAGDAFSGEGWIFERKFDGVRCLAHRDGDRVRLLSRNRLPANYPEITDALAAQPVDDFVVDGEVVALDSRGRTSFGRLQRRMQLSSPDQARRSGVAVHYYVFDVLRALGQDTTRLPLRQRKALLRELLDWGGPLRYTTHRNAAGEAYLEEACRRGWEGLIAKRADAPYRSGRSRDWLKLKCGRSQEMVVAGWTDPRGGRSGLGALLLGYHEGGGLVYAGRVGTGFDQRTLQALSRVLAELEQPRSPFTAGDPPREGTRGVHWARPDLVCEVAFSEWTGDGRLRHPRYLGLRTDKAAREVVRERPVA